MLLRSFLVVVSALAVPLASVVDAQDTPVLTGSWQGTLVPVETRGAGRLPAMPPRLPVLVIIAIAEDGTYSWTWRSAALNGTAPIGVTIEGDRIRISVPVWDGSWEGKLSADDSTLDGKWRQAGMSHNQSLVLKRVSLETSN